MCKVDRHFEVFRNAFMNGELLTIVERHRMALPLVGAKQANYCYRYSLGMLAGKHAGKGIYRDTLFVRVTKAPF
ncbi:MAG: hypothetical protein L6271_18340 [Desulfobacteraceae bacterium]|nr:hypothetical protein [Desulfobacteraceae bacterium]